MRDHILLLYWIYICFNLPLLYMVIKAPAIDLGDMLIQLFLQQLLKTHTEHTSLDIPHLILQDESVQLLLA